MNYKLVKNSLLILVIFFITINSGFAQIEFAEIKSKTQWTELKAKAQAEGKLIFLDIYATWCGPCKYLDKEVYTDFDLGKLHNDLYINTKIDGESPFGKQLAAFFELRAYPTMYYLTPDEELVAKVVGVREAGPLSVIGKSVSDNSVELISFGKEFKAKNLDARELKAYQILLTSIGQDELATKVAAEVLPTLTDAEILDPVYKDVVVGATADIDSRIYNVLKDNRDKVFELWGKDTAELVFSNIYNASLSKAIAQKSEAYLTRIIDELLPVYIGQNAPNMEYAKFITMKIYYANTNDWDAYKSFILEEYRQKHNGKDNFLHHEAYEIAQEYNQIPTARDFAAELMTMALELERSVANLSMSAYIEGLRGNFELASQFIAEAEVMEMSDDERKMILELKKLLDKSRLGAKQ